MTLISTLGMMTTKIVEIICIFLLRSSSTVLYSFSTTNQPTTMSKTKLIDINAVSYEESKKYQWKATEPMKRKGDKWSQRCVCQKTGAKGIRRGFYL